MLISLVLLTGAMLIGLARTFMGPSLEDRMLAVLLLGSGGVALLLKMAVLFAAPALMDVALVLALLAVVAAAALTRKQIRHD
ncbi:MAG: hypothetical protein KDI83_04650 [Gammaproteobacteria bacterium]|nr:hypothetical protein [Gammaproteobacteria bacterium]